jgi:hypothetical protein
LRRRTAPNRLGVSRQTVWQRVKRGEIEAIHVRRGRKKGLRLKLICSQPEVKMPPGAMGQRTKSLRCSPLRGAHEPR